MNIPRKSRREKKKKGTMTGYNRESGQSHNSFLFVSSFFLYFTTTITTSSSHIPFVFLFFTDKLRQEL